VLLHHSGHCLAGLFQEPDKVGEAADEDKGFLKQGKAPTGDSKGRLERPNAIFS